MRERDPAGRVLAVPSQTPGLIEEHDLSPAEVARSAWTVDTEGRKLSGAAAINRVWRELPAPWPGIARLYGVPALAWLEERVYRAVARNRSSLSRIWGDPPEAS